MHIKTGTWEGSNMVCESDALCDPTVLVSATNSEPHIRNRRLSPGSSSCGGGGGGSIAGKLSPGHPQGNMTRTTHVHAFALRRERDGRGKHTGYDLRRDGLKGTGRVTDRPQKPSPRQRWVEDSLSLLKPPPAFPVQDSPAKLQPTVSYASKVKSRAAGVLLEGEPPAIGVLLENQWGLSFISEVQQAAEGSIHPTSTVPIQLTASKDDNLPQDIQHPKILPSDEMRGVAATSIGIGPCADADESNGKLLLSCCHLVEALRYHNREWSVIRSKQKDPKKIVWYKNSQEQPA